MGRQISGHVRFRKAEETAGFTSEKLIDAIEGAYIGKRRDSGWVQKKTFSPSSLGYGHAVCPRFWYLSFEGYNYIDNTDAKGIVTMETGTVSHQRIQSALRDAGILLAEEIEVKLTDPPIRGFVDVLVQVGEDVVIGEIKTTGQDIFNLKQLSMKPSPNHLIQILTYMKGTGKDKGFLLYENRNDLSLLVIEVNMNETNEAIIENVFNWLREVRSAWENKELPMRPFRKQDGKVCMACPINKSCWVGNPEGTIKINKMEVPKP